MNDDEDAIPTQPPSRSQRRREALAILALAESAIALPPRVLARLPLPEAIRASIERTRRITSRIARKREIGYLAKLLRADAAAASVLEKAIAGADHGRSAREAAHWAERLLREGDAALARLCALHPTARQLPLKPLLSAARQAPTDPRGPEPKPHRRLRRMLAELFASSRSRADD